MAIFDTSSGVVVIRVVYDGPPLSGKTTSMRALARSLARELKSPGEAEGRTLYFDWMDYVGGLFDGSQIRCQIVGVPGQRALASRRLRVLSSADSVVYVADTTRPQLETSLAGLSNSYELLEALGPPPVGVVLQANKRDADDAVSLDELRERVSIFPSVGIKESIALEGVGIRETFVFAVRLALDRVRELSRTRSLPTGRPDDEDADDLLRTLRTDEAFDRSRGAGRLEGVPSAWNDVLARSSIQEALDLDSRWDRPATIRPRTPTTPPPETVPLPPDPTVPGGMIWPPVEGRVLLNHMASESLATAPLPGGDWEARGNAAWKVHSYGGALFDDLDSGRRALVEWARLHASSARRLSPGRCIVLAEDGRDRFRLWQIVRAERSIAEIAGRGIADVDEDEIAARLLRSARLLLRATKDFVEPPVALPCTITTIGEFESRPVFIGLMPATSNNAAPAPLSAEAIRHELAALIDLRVLRGRAVDVPRVLRGIEFLSKRHADARGVTEVLSAMLIRE